MKPRRTILIKYLQYNRLYLKSFTSTHYCKSYESSDISSSQKFETTKIIDECLSIRSSVQIINDKFKGPLEYSSQKNTILPFVFLLGNHSSGKSSFINYLCQRKIQTSGVAPTDDKFTVIGCGHADKDRDGPALIGDPDMGFCGLRMFGPNLVHHTELKIRNNLAIKNFMVVDSPGMIDSPMVRDSKTGFTQRAVMDRGYDFEGVCRWYAERADIILLFFDPDKPGTTGETLQILTNALVGMDQKLLIILNKADQFRKIHDFARAYGSLCWNLSKVIHRKDLPQIYTMCLPPSFQSRASNDQSDEQSSLGKGLIDLEATREEVVAKVNNAPFRRIDNEITRLSDAVSLLQMHCKIVNEIRKKYRKTLYRSRAFIGLTGISSCAISTSLFMIGMPLEITATFSAFSFILTGAVSWWQTSAVEEYAKLLVSSQEMEIIFQHVYARRIAENDEFIVSLWKRVHDHLKLGLSSSDLQALPNVSSTEVSRLDKILEVEIPRLRRSAAPSLINN